MRYVYRVTPIVNAEVVSVDETTAVFLPYPAEDVGAGDVGGKVEIFVVMELDYFRYFLCYQVDTGDAAGNGRCVNGVGVGDTVEIWFFGGLSVGYRNLAERLKLS